MGKSVLVLGTILFFYLGLVVFSYRALYFSRFDEAYWKDKYEQSQWKLPASDRILGDDGLYLYEGYRLIRGHDPSLINAEVPPLGKYLIGASILIFGNGYIYGLLITSLTLCATFLLARRVLDSTVSALAVTTVLAADPLMTNQYKLTMIDALQSALLTVFFAVLYTPIRSKRSQIFQAIASGIILGLYSEAKIALLTPILGLAGITHLWGLRRDIRILFMFLISTVAGYIFPYIPYFTMGHTIIDWLRLQKWVLSFYLHGNLTPTWGSAVTTIFSGLYQNIFSRIWQRAAEWSPVWGIMFLSVLGFMGAWICIKPKNIRTGILAAVTCTTMGIFSIIPFWSRYLVAILPLLYITGSILLTRLTPRLKTSVFLILLSVNIYTSLPVLFPSPASSVDQFVYQTEHRLFADLYEDLTEETKKTMSRDRFRSFGMSTLLDAEVEYIRVEPKEGRFTDRDRYDLSADITYGTRNLGMFTISVSVPFERENNRWHIPWRWSILLPDLTDTRHVRTEVIRAKRGSILASDKKPLAEDVPGRMVFVTPGSIDKSREDELLSLLETMFGKRPPKVAIHQRIVGNSLPDRPIAIGVIPYDRNDARVMSLMEYPGVTLTDAYARVTHPNNFTDIGTLQNSSFAECCTRLYSTTNYDGASGTEKFRNAVLKGVNGGSLTVRDPDGTVITTYISREKKDGTDAQP